jgi:hypothetical protein
VRLLEHNILEGGGADDRFARWAAWVASRRPDVLCLCECNGWPDGRLDAARRATGLPHGVVLPDGPSDYPPGVLARRPVERLAELRGGFAHGALHVRVGPLEIVVAHLAAFDEERRVAEAAELVRHLAPVTGPALLVGDLNSHSRADEQAYRTAGLDEAMLDFRVHDRLTAAGLTDLGARAEALDYTTATRLNPDEPKRRLDYIYANAAFVERFGRPIARVLRADETADLSDHWPVEVAWNAPTADEPGPEPRE